VGESEVMIALRSEIEAVAPLGSTVLLTGETGTGKGRVARIIHRLSKRSDHPFVHVDCAALSATIIESELFGHERGSFTNAISRRAGRFELAGNGTIFLDEIADLEPRLQSKLLRVLDDRQYERIGGMETLAMRARVIAATSHDIRIAVQEHRFRPDLYYRLNVFHLSIPPLRERASDIPRLADDILMQLAGELEVAVPRPTTDFLDRLMAHLWPGNVRELANVLERLVARHPGQTLPESALNTILESWAPVGTGRPERKQEPTTLADLIGEISERERREILSALEWSRGSVAGAARRLQIPRSTLRHRMYKYSIVQPGRRVTEAE
jgi:transcriptional regulator with GAF, ATPase, and Fis domain